MKRYQVLLPDWLEENIKFYVEEYDLSFSEVIRAEICSAILATVPKQFPEYKPGLSHDDMVNLMKQNAQKKLERDDALRWLSKVYFEARKASEYRLKKLKAKRK